LVGNTWSTIRTFHLRGTHISNSCGTRLNTPQPTSRAFRQCSQPLQDALPPTKASNRDLGAKSTSRSPRPPLARKDASTSTRLFSTRTTMSIRLAARHQNTTVHLPEKCGAASRAIGHRLSLSHSVFNLPYPPSQQQLQRPGCVWPTLNRTSCVTNPSCNGGSPQRDGPSHPAWRVVCKVGKAPSSDSSDESGSIEPGRVVGQCALFR
jgi:hypothetical protein